MVSSLCCYARHMLFRVSPATLLGCALCTGLNRAFKKIKQNCEMQTKTGVLYTEHNSPFPFARLTAS